MIMFIRNIPGTVSHTELCEFLSDGLRHLWGIPLLKKEKVETCDIMRIKDLDMDRVEYHGLAFVANEKTAGALIRQLNRGALAGEKMEVRKYRARSRDRDRRRQLSPTQNRAIVDRRRKERRRPNLLIETLYRPQSDILKPLSS